MKESCVVHVTLEEKLAETKAVWDYSEDEVKRLEDILSVTQTSNRKVTPTI